MMQHIDSNGRRSRAVIANGMIYFGGQVGDDLSADVGTQTRQALARMDKILSDAGSDRSKLVQATIWLKSMDDYAEMNMAWDEWIDRDRPPARACGVVEMADPGIRVEIIAVAMC